MRRAAAASTNVSQSSKNGAHVSASYCSERAERDAGAPRKVARVADPAGNGSAGRRRCAASRPTSAERRVVMGTISAYQAKKPSVRPAQNDGRNAGARPASEQFGEAEARAVATVARAERWRTRRGTV